MLIRIDILDKAIQAARIKKKNIKEKVILMDPRGKAYTHEYARKLSSLDHLIIICGHYEGIDERIYNFIDGAVSIGKYVLTGGEIPAMVICDSVCRLIKGVLAKDDATINESFSQINNLEAPQYTKPQKYKGYEVPEILLSGNHQAISDWKRKNTKLFE